MKKLSLANNGGIVFLLGVLLTIFAPIIITRPASFEWMIFADDSFANVGSTIGGVTAPIVGLVGSWLLYLTLQEQKNANRDNVLLTSIQHLDSFIVSNGIFESNDFVESKLDENFDVDSIDETGILMSNTDPTVISFAQRHVYSLMSIAIQIEIINNGIWDSSSEIIKQRLSGIIYNLKNSVAYKSILQSRASIVEDNGSCSSPATMINEIEKKLNKWQSIPS